MDTANIQFGLESIEQIYCSLAVDDLGEVSADHLKISINTQTVIIPAKNRIKIMAGVGYMVADKVVFRLDIALVFAVGDLNKAILIDKEEQKVHCRADIIPTLLNISIGTLRGIAHEKTNNSPLHNYPLPLIDGDWLVDKNTIHISDE